MTRVLWDVDTQRDFMLPEGKLYVPGAEDTASAMARLVAAAREAGLVHVASADDHELTDPEISDDPDLRKNGTGHGAKTSLLPGCCRRHESACRNLDMPIAVRAIGKSRQYRCGIILDIYRRIFARAGLKGVSALCARRTIAERLTARGCDVDQVGAVLGLTERNSVRNLIQNEHPSPRPLKAVVRDLV